MAAPAMSFPAEGNVLSSQTLAAGGTVTVDVDASAKIEQQVQVKNGAGATVATTSGVQVDTYRKFGPSGSEVIDNQSVTPIVVPATASTNNFKSVALPTGKWRIKLTNLDTSNAVTVEITGATVDGIS